MGFLRFMAKSTGIGQVASLTKNILENGVVDGVKKEIKETWTEDIPVTAILYKMGNDDGKIEGKKEGYVQASNEYEKKMLNQAKNFLEQKDKLVNSIEERDRLLDEYTSYIEKQESQISELTEEQLQLLKEMSNMKISLLASK